jgi:drug/metabolite transporter (DMT)-like permease
MPPKNQRQETGLVARLVRFAPLATYAVLQALTLALRKRAASGMEQYPYVLTLFQPMFTTVLFTVLAILLRQRDEVWRMGPTVCAAMGLLITLSTALVFSGSRGHVVPGAVVVLLQQAVIPSSFVVSFFVLRRSFGWTHVAGALLVVGGIVSSVAPGLGSSGDAAGAGAHSSGRALRVVLILCSAVPLAGAIAALDAHFARNPRLGLLAVWAWVNLAELVAALPLALLVLPVQGLPLSAFGPNVRDGTRCLFADTGPAAAGGGGGDGGGSSGDVDVAAADDDCSGSLASFLGFIAVLVLARVNQAHLVRAGTSSLSFVSGACAVPIAEALMAIPGFMPHGASHAKWHAGMAVGIVAVTIGAFLYRWRDEGSHDAAPRSDRTEQESLLVINGAVHGDL